MEKSQSRMRSFSTRKCNSMPFLLLEREWSRDEIISFSSSQEVISKSFKLSVQELHKFEPSQHIEISFNCLLFSPLQWHEIQVLKSRIIIHKRALFFPFYYVMLFLYGKNLLFLSISPNYLSHNT